MPQPTSAESDDNRACFGFPAIAGKKFSAGFDGGRLTSDGGVVLLGQAERQMEIAERLAARIADPRDQSRVIHGKADILRALILVIACDCAPASNAEPHLAPLNSLIGRNKEKLGQCKSASRGTPLWSTLSIGYSNT